MCVPAFLGPCVLSETSKWEVQISVNVALHTVHQPTQCPIPRPLSAGLGSGEFWPSPIVPALDKPSLPVQPWAALLLPCHCPPPALLLPSRCPLPALPLPSHCPSAALPLPTTPTWGRALSAYPMLTCVELTANIFTLLTYGHISHRLTMSCLPEDLGVGGNTSETDPL